MLDGILMGWVITPFIAGVITFFALFFVQNVFNLKVTSSGPAVATEKISGHDLKSNSNMYYSYGTGN